MTSRRRVGAIIAIAALLAAVLVPSGAAVAATPSVSRLAGPDRYGTSAAISAASFAPGVAVAYVASGADFPDALSGAAAAGTKSAPVLLTQPTSIPAVIRTELARLRPAEIIVLGGEPAVSQDVFEALRSFTAGEVRRLAGPDRYGTSAAVSAATFAAGIPVAYLASGTAFPDALSVASVAGGRGGPILLTGRDTLPDVIRDELARLRPSELVVLGSNLAVSDAVAQAAASAAGASLQRQGGSDRYGTSAAISAAAFAPGVPVVYLASGANFPDALSGAAAARGAPLLVTRPDAIPVSVAMELTRLRPARIIVLGAAPAVSNAVSTQAAVVGSDLAPATGAQLTKATEVRVGTCLPSANSAYRLCVTPAGAVTVDRGTTVLWSSGTSDPVARALRILADGNAVLYSADGRVIWESGTPGTAASALVVQDDGDVRLRTPTGATLWASMTAPSSPRWDLPFASGQRWSAGGPHGSPTRAEARGSLDFGPRAGGSTRALAIADGTVFAVQCGGGASFLGIRHADGWESTYYHLVNEQRQLVGTFVTAGTYLGDVGRELPCGGGATFDHVHLSIRHAGITVSVEGMTFGGYTARGSGRDYWGFWTDAAGRTVVTARGGAACCLTAP